MQESGRRSRSDGEGTLLISRRVGWEYRIEGGRDGELGLCRGRTDNTKALLCKLLTLQGRLTMSLEAQSCLGSPLLLLDAAPIWIGIARKSRVWNRIVMI